MKVVAAVPDLFFSSRLQEVARRSGDSLTTVANATQFEEALATNPPSLVLVDLAARGLDSIAVIRRATQAGISEIIAFGPHKDLTARADALAAGATRWVTNQRLIEVLAEILRNNSAAPLE